MRKLILSISTLLTLAQAANAQTHTQTSTGFSNDCDAASGTGYGWDVYVPDCSNNVNGGGGTNAAPLNEVRVQWGRDASAGYVYCMFNLTTNLDLSLASNQHFSATLSSVDPGDDTNQEGYTGNDTPLNMSYSFRLENAADPANPIALTNYATAFALTGTPTATTLDFSGLILTGADMTTVNRIVFRYDDCNTSQSGDGRGALVVSDLKLGTPASPTSVNDAYANSAVSIYPNPATSTATVEVNSLSASNVQVVVSDIYGTPVKTVVTGSTAGSLKETFNVSDLRAGIYFVSFQVDGKAVKTEKLVIQ